jgi:tellurite methyltransferase
MKDLPDNVTSYNKTPELTRATIPKGLLRRHLTKEGTWGKIIILEGRLRYRILEPELEEIELSPERYGVVEPAVPQELEPICHVRFYVEFFSESDT